MWKFIEHVGCITNSTRFAKTRLPHLSEPATASSVFVASPATILIAYLTFLSFSATCSAQIQRAHDAPQPRSPEASAQSVQMPEGFRLELVASEPLVEEPSCVAFDEWGRLFVCELHGYNVEGEIDVAELNKTGQLDRTVRRIRWELQGGEIAEAATLRQFGKLKLLIDDDGDGRMDRAETWADDLPACYGIVPARGGILVVAAPEIVFFADRDLDGKPDEREVMFSGFRKEVMERGINNPRWGYDGWIYVGSGGSGGRITGPRLAQPVELGKSDFRIRADGTAIEPVHGSVGTFGLTINRYGDRFPASGGQPANYALPLPYEFLARNPHVASPRSTHSAANYNRGFRLSQPHPWRVERRKDPAWVRFYGERETDSSYFSGGCSNEFYDDDHFPAKFRDSLFYCEPSLNIIHRCELRRDGLRYVALRAASEQDHEFLASTDPWFRPMNLRTGPDGALYIVDMYREIIEDYSAIPRFLQQQYGLDQGRSHGRIWRLTHASAPKTNGPNWPNFANFTNPALVKELGSAIAWRRMTAQRLLLERGSDGMVRQVRKLLAQSGSPTSPTPGTSTSTSTSSPMPAVHALAVLAGWNELSVNDVITALSHPDERVCFHAIRRSHKLLANSPELLPQILAHADSPSKVIRAEVAMALGATDTPEAASGLQPLLLRDGGDAWMRAAILSSSTQHAEQLLHASLRDEQMDVLVPLAATFGAQCDGSALNALLSKLLHQDSKLQHAVLIGLLKTLPSTIRIQQPTIEVFEGFLSSSSTDVQRSTVKLAARVGMQHSRPVRQFYQRELDVVVDRTAAEEQRVEAMQALHNAPLSIIEQVLASCLSAEETPAIQLAAIETADTCNDKDTAQRLLAEWSGFSPKIRKRALAALFTRADRLDTLWQFVRAGTISVAELSAAQREQLSMHLGDDHRQELTQLDSSLASVPDGPAETTWATYLGALATPGEEALGKNVFRQHCAQCHRFAGQGHHVGPDLGTVGNRPNEAVLLDILKPNDRVDLEYRSYSIVTKDGRTHTGIITSETATNIVLTREKSLTSSLLRREIAHVQSSNLSLMPADLHKTLKPVDIKHLLTYLRSDPSAR